MLQEPTARGPGTCQSVLLGAVDLERDLKPWGQLRAPGEECNQRREKAEGGGLGPSGLEVGIGSETWWGQTPGWSG